MIGAALILIATFFDEISSTIGRKKILKKQESIYTFGFLQIIWGLLFMLILLVYRESYVFSAASIPTLVLRVILELAQVYSSLHALRYADRSTIGFLMVTTVPLLLVVDIIVGYPIGQYQIIGILVLTIALLFLTSGGGLSKKGIHYVLFSAVNAAATISLYKYHITHFNSPEVEQGIVYFFLLIFLYFLARQNSEDPFKFLFKKGFISQSVTHGIGMVCVSFSLVFVAPSIFVALRRVFNVLSSLLSGYYFFHERHIAIKAISFACVAASIFLFSI